MSAADTRTPDPLWADLQGHNLIEASAGTGKTFTIAGLYLRLVVEAERRVSEILVVTFTEAATEELRERIRDRLESARAAVAAGSSDDHFLGALLERLGDLRRADLLLQRAVQSFDQAAIHTIHGFCQRALADHAFESGRPFDVQLLPDQEPLLQEVCSDFWRRETHGADADFVAHLRDNGLSPEDLASRLRPYLGKPDLAVRPPDTVEGCDAAPDRYRRAYAEARRLWNEGAESIRDRLLEALPGLNANQYSRDKVEGWLDGLQEVLATEDPPPGGVKEPQKLGATALEKGTKKGHETPAHPFFGAFDELLEASEALAGCLDFRRREFLRRALEYAWEELPRRKADRRVQSFDDLLLNLDRALAGPGGDGLAEALRRRHPVALIDEFQDTDPTQYRILRRVYAGTGGPLFLVGDPKQAIYAFRGADVFAYLEAKTDVEADPRGGAYSLPRNWRSTPALVDAFNALFRPAHPPFWFEAIPYQPVEAAPKAHDALVLPESFGAEPFRWWFLEGATETNRKGEVKEKPKSKGAAAEEAVAATAAEIARLLAAGRRNEAGLRTPDGGWRPLGGGDIAVLVRTHRHAQQVRAALGALGIASVEHSQTSVFHTAEAEALERVLLAVADPQNEPLARGALASPFHGYNGEALHALAGDEAAWDRVLDGFQGLHDRWRREGFIPMFRQWLAHYGIRARMLELPQGERRLTNLLHLGELLQRQSVEARLGPEGLLSWLAGRRQAEGQAGGEEQLRLESDENLVQLVTIHKSKGLEYPVVFCPFLWDLPIRKADGDLLEFHDPGDGNRLTLDLGSADREEAEARFREESLAESLRLLYVAVTRAAHRLYAVTGRINQLERSALGYLLHLSADRVRGVHDPEAFKEALKARGEEDLRNDLRALTGAAPRAFDVEDPDPEPPEPDAAEAAAAVASLAHRPFNRVLPPDRFVTSFSGLIRGTEEERPAFDLGEAAPAAPEAPGAAEEGIAAFPRGPRAGSCLHAVMEAVDFTAGPEDWAPEVEGALRGFGFDAQRWTGTVTAMAEAATATPLGGPLGEISLADVAPEKRRDELEFYYPLARLEPEGLNRVLSDHGYRPGAAGPEQGAALAFRPLEGYLRGFIDLTFEVDGRYYLADYKSNRLGPTPAAYTPEALAEAVHQHGYALQYLLYTVALHRFLGRHLPGYDYDRHLGGAYYLFLRGMDSRRGPGAGVYFDRPERGLIEALDALFRGET
ncbi:MAG: exodeoxyribonuclease V subunit beta [Thiohalorhabdus sp.]